MDVRVTVTGTQFLDGQEDVVEQGFTGTLEPTADGFRLAYTDEEEHTVTSLFLRRGQVLVECTGARRSRMVLSPQRRWSGYYQTAYGEWPLETETRELTIALTAQGGTIAFSYTLWLGGAETGQHTVRLTIVPAPTGNTTNIRP